MKIPSLIKTRSLKNLAKSEGTTILEMAVSLPILMMITFGFIYFSLVVLGMCNTCFASRAAARYASLHSNTSYSPTTQTALNQIVAPFAISYPSNTYTVSYAYGGTNTIGQTVAVNVSISYTMSIFGTTYSPISFGWRTSGIVIS